MAINARQILDTALNLGKAAVSAAEKRLRERTGGTPAETSGGPATVGAAEPGKPGGPKSATAEARHRAAAGRSREGAGRQAGQAQVDRDGGQARRDRVGRWRGQEGSEGQACGDPKAAVEEGKAAASGKGEDAGAAKDEQVGAADAASGKNDK